MNMLHQIAYSDVHTPCYFGTSTAQSFPRLQEVFTSDSSSLWTDVLGPDVAQSGFGSQYNLNLGIAPSFIDPRTVVDSTHTVKRETSPFSAMSIGFNGKRGSQAIESQSSANADDPHEEAQSLTFNPTQFDLSSLEMNSLYHSPAQSYSTARSSPPTALMTPSHRIADGPANNALPVSGKSQPTSAEKQLTPPPSPPVRRRGPGRPSKAQAAAQYPNNKRPTGHSAVKLRRQMHNDSAMRSRARLNNTLEELWNIVPKHERVLDAGLGEADFDDNREVCRAVKVEMAIAYLKKLQKGLEEREAGTSLY